MIDLRAIGSEFNEITKYECGVKTKYIVDKVYPFFVKCHDHNGNVECFNIGDLVVMGLISTNNPRYGAAGRYKWEAGE